MTAADTHDGALMVVDDDPDIREILQLLLETDGYQVVTAKDGRDAVEKIDGGVHPAFVLLDLMMPRMDGEEFLDCMAARGLSDVPVVIMSGHAASANKATRQTVSARLTKPLNLGDLMQLVHRLAPPHPGSGEEGHGRSPWEEMVNAGPPP